MSPREITVQPLTADAFAPFGEVLDASGAPDRIINAGLCGRHHDLAKLDFPIRHAAFFSSEDQGALAVVGYGYKTVGDFGWAKDDGKVFSGFVGCPNNEQCAVDGFFNRVYNSRAVEDVSGTYGHLPSVSTGMVGTWINQYEPR